MAKINKGINIIFRTVIILLAAIAAVSMYLNRNLPIVREAPPLEVQPETSLPENHPPIATSSQLVALEQMDRNNPGNPDIKVQIGNAYYDLGQYRKAILAYEEALKIRPMNAGAETDLATCYHELGQHDKALAILDRVLVYRPNFVQALFNKGIVLQAGKKDLKGAITVWEQLLQSNPDYPQKAALEQKINQLKAVGR